MNPAYVVIGVMGVVVVAVVLLALVAWPVAIRWLNGDGPPMRASLEEQVGVPPRAEAELEREEQSAKDGGLDRAKDRNVGRAWGG